MHAEDRDNRPVLRMQYLPSGDDGPGAVPGNLRLFGARPVRVEKGEGDGRMMGMPAPEWVPENLVEIQPRGRSGSRFSGGWLLLEGRLWRQGGDYDARLYWDIGEGWTRSACHRVPTTAAGVINELVFLPDGVRRLALHPGRAVHGTIDGLRARPVGRLYRPLAMMRRVVAMFWLKSPDRRRQAGLTIRRTLIDLEGAYRAAGNLRAHAAAPDYADWCSRHDQLSSMDEHQISSHVGTWENPPFFHVLVVGSDAAEIQRTRASLDAQLFRSFSCTFMNEGDSAAILDFNARLRGAADHWSLVLRAGDSLAPHALYWLAWVAQSSADLHVVYSDEDAIDSWGRRSRPCFKPDWSLAYARSACYLAEAVALRASTLAAAGGLEADDCSNGCHGAVFRVLDLLTEAGPRAVAHIPAILLHRLSRNSRKTDVEIRWAMDAVRQHLQRRNVRATVEHTHAGTWRVRYELEHHPLVSVIIPTRDALALTRRCIGSLRELTRYGNYEILLVDNQSRDAEAMEWMRAQASSGAVRLLAYDRPFNYSAINNMAVQAAHGELVCLLNNDTEIVDAGWLDEMVSQALQPRVDVVGAKLLYPDGMVQHGGDLVGVGGVANHAHAWIGKDDPGYCERAIATQEYSAVTAACLLTWRRRYLDLGGLDERNFPVSFNDVDYCLRVRAAGGHVVWTPHAVLVHHESATRGSDVSRVSRWRLRGEAARMRRRWRDELRQDPFYNPNLNHMRADFSLDHAPLVPKPWRR